MNKFVKKTLENKEKLQKALSAKPISEKSSLEKTYILGKKKPLTAKTSIYDTYMPPKRRLEFKKFKNK